MAIEALTESDRPRERLLQSGPGALTDRDLVAVILGTGSDGEGVLELAERVTRSVNLRLLPRVPAEELLAIRGLGPARVAQLLAAAEMGRRLWPDGEAASLVRGPETVFELTRTSADRTASISWASISTRGTRCFAAKSSRSEA
jgi:DNA repair protein RadC